MTWFEEYPECPVSGCSCRCSSLDVEDNAAKNILEENGNEAIETK
jgi:hypothetical protein